MDNPTDCSALSPILGEKSEAQAAIPAPASRGYKMTIEGLMFSGSDSERATLISDPFEIVGETHDETGGSRCVVIRWTDRDDFVHERAIPRGHIAGKMHELKVTLADEGLTINSAPGALALFSNFLLKVDKRKTTMSVDRLGWHDDAYVSIHQTYSAAQTKDIVFRPKQPGHAIPKPSGSLKDWQDSIGALSCGNSRLILACCTALAPALMHLVGEDSGGIHIVGGSSSGKSTSMYVAGSIAGTPIGTWRTTANGAEGRASQCNDGLMILDELGQAEGKHVNEMTYMLGNGIGKIRAGKSGAAKAPEIWRLLFISTGEVGLHEKFAEANLKPRPGQLVRFLEIPSDAGNGYRLFETLHAFEDGDKLSRHIKSAAMQYHGTAFHAFMTEVTKNIEMTKERVKALRAEWLESNLPEGADGQVSRPAQRFALIAAAGELAIEFGVFPWPTGEAARGISVCFRAWLERRGGSGALEATNAVEQVREFIVRYGASRFAVLEEGKVTKEVPNRAGWRRKAGQGWDYLCAALVFQSEICKGIDYKAAAKTLAEKGLLVAGKENTSKTAKIDGESIRVYWIKSAIMGDES